MADHTAMREYMLRLFVWDAERGDKFASREEAEEFFWEWLAEEHEIARNAGMKLYQELHPDCFPDSM